MQKDTKLMQVKMERLQIDQFDRMETLIRQVVDSGQTKDKPGQGPDTGKSREVEKSKPFF